MLASLLRLGFIANFISDPVLVGFKAGIALVIVLDQLPKLLGIHFHKGTFLRNLLAIVRGNRACLGGLRPDRGPGSMSDAGVVTADFLPRSFRIASR